MACLLGLTFAGIGVAIVLRPAFAANMRALLGLEPVRMVAKGSFYAVRVAPVFEQNCVGCHGPRASKGHLRLDTLTAVFRGGKNGAVIAPGHPDASELIRRITLPPTDDRAMPPSGKTPLDKDAITVVRLWVARGASGDLAAAAIKDAPRLIPPVRIPETDLREVERARAPLRQQVEELQKRFPGVLAYQSRGSADLEINASLLGKRFNDDAFSALAPLKDRVVRLDVSRTAVTDSMAALLSQMPRLGTLRLADTAVTDVTVARLARLPSLKSLTISGTAVTAAALVPLHKRGVSIHGEANGS
jgi:mono/diheme cytochrome c family protein